MANIYIFGGGKGGVGKTTAALALAKIKQDATAYECDSTNPDLARALALGFENLFDPAQLIAWSEKVLESAKAGDVIVNLPGGGDRVFLRNAEVLAGAAGDDGNKIYFISTLNRSRECLVLLAVTLEQLDASGVVPCIVLNEFFGEAAAFSRFSSAKNLRSRIAAAGGAELVLPELKDFAVDAMLSPGGEDLATAKPLVKRLFDDWLKKTAANFAAI